MTNKTKIIIFLWILIFVVRGYILFDILVTKNNNTENLISTWSLTEQTATSSTWNSQNNFLENSQTWVLSIPDIASEISISIPSWMLTPGLIEVADKFTASSQTDINFLTATWLQNYYDLVNSWFTNNTFDIALVSTDTLISYQNYAFNLSTKENLWSYFHESFWSFFWPTFAKVIPYAIDPLIIITNNNNKNSTVTLSTIFDFFSYRPDWKLLFWYDIPSLELLKSWQEPYPWYFLSLYYLIKDRYLSNNINHFKRFLDQQSNTKRSLINLRRELSKLETTNSNCSKFWNICLLANQKIESVPGFLSDIVIWDTVFAKSIENSDNAILYQFPVTSPPQRWRVFVINKNSDLSRLNASLSFLADYIKNWNNWNARLVPNKMISAFNSILDLQLTFPLYKNIKQSRDKRELILWSHDWQKLYTTKTDIIQALLWNINLELYFSKPGWTY